MRDTGAWPLATRHSGPVSDRGAGPRAITYDCFAEDGDAFREMIFIEIEELSRPHLRRLAAKIAFEHFASTFGAEAAVGSEFEEAKKFIKEGAEATEPIAGVLSEEAHLTGPLDYPVLTHASFVIGHPEDRTLGGFVAFFGVFYYWVILSRDYRTDSVFNRLLMEYPSERAHEEWELAREGVGGRVNWDLVIETYCRDRLAAVTAAKRNAAKKFQKFVDAHFGPPATGDLPGAK